MVKNRALKTKITYFENISKIKASRQKERG